MAMENGAAELINSSPLPRKSAVGLPSDPRLAPPISAPTSSTGTAAAPAGIPGPEVGLPEGVTIPPTVDRSLLQGRLLETLKRLPAQLINDALVEYDEAVKSKAGQIRSHGAYLMGVIKRYASVQERAEGSGAMPMGQELTPAVNDRLQKLVDDNFCTMEEMNDKVKSKIRMLSEKDALFAIDELSSVERGQIRNFGSYFMGILNRYMRGERGPSKPGHSKERYRSSQSGREYRSRYDRGDREDRDYRRRRDDSPPRGRSYQRDRYGSRDDPEYDSYRRDRSRDRYDDDRRRSEYRRNTARSDHPRDSFRSERYDPRLQSPQQGGYNATSSTVPPPPPPPRATAQPPPQISGIGSFNPQHQQQNLQQQSQPQNQQVLQNQYIPQAGVAGAYSLSSAPAGTPAYVASTAPPGAPSGYVASSVPSVANPSSYGAQGTFNSTQQTFVQQLGLGQQPNTTGNQFQQQGGANYPGPLVASVAPPATMNSNNFQPQGQAPTDILGLANRAASAVQALASQNALRASAAAPAPQQLSTNYYTNSGVAGAPAPSPARPGRTTATLDELPTLVQFAVKNLQATGHVDGELDGGILGMIKNLPEAVALQSLEKFSTCDTSTMRNKAAYLAGILRRELEKLGRR